MLTNTNLDDYYTAMSNQTQAGLVQVVFMATEAERRLIRIEAAKRGMTMRELIRHMVIDVLKSGGNDERGNQKHSQTGT